ncbi:hypothetical protein CJM00_08865 [Campylobacter jejuni]|uniref:YopX protein domain-containing protein n=1 Tax=Campylobacter jejuni TaxID=197 RepID=A0A624F4P0_CAMJU|nr:MULTISPECIES: YopX family protein [Campylobacter]EAI7024799.1 hypothetical protein [Campylobacter jejuni]EAK8706059.1 hypothetical protein [Campylobacter jejuni]ECZ5737805.1 hypothetical protein [Campylobacter jejuni]MBX1905124.1 hypothetical protein [Campylobacter jejuni]MBX2559984.1 hypothetical protein [Campylobacter jejuni]
MKLQDFDFRIWNNETERYETNKPLISLLMIDVLTRVAHLNGNKFEIELWTGYFDKNGNKIYENDIIKNESLEEIYYITRDNTYKMFKIIIYDKDCNENLYRKKNPADINLLKMLVSDKNMSVIGNIHENPELLKC